MRLVVRTWNLFHGNAYPPERAAFLEEAVRLASADAPDVLCLQELPVWSLGLLDDWSGMTSVADVAARPRLGPVPSTAELGKWLTELHHGLFRSAFTGQGNAILLGSRLQVAQHDALVLNPWSYRRAQARRLQLGLVARLAWGKERRICQVLRVRCEDGPGFVAANLHATSFPLDRRLADSELLRAATFVDAFARPDEAVVLCGDFNVSVRNSRILPELEGDEWGFDGASRGGIDHILVRGLRPGRVTRWPLERRRVKGRVVSDHAPVEREVG